MVALFVIESIKWLANNEIIILYPGREAILGQCHATALGLAGFIYSIPGCDVHKFVYAIMLINMSKLVLDVHSAAIY